MIRLLVLYGPPKDPAAFDRYYQESHLPIARRMKGLRKWTIGKVLGTADGKPSPYHYIADLYMDSREDFDQLLASPEGLATPPAGRPFSIPKSMRCPAWRARADGATSSRPAQPRQRSALTRRTWKVRPPGSPGPMSGTTIRFGPGPIRR